MNINWLNEKLVPAANRFSRLRVIDSIVGGFRFALPIILIGAIFQIVGNIVALATGGEGEMIPVVNIMNNLTFGLLGIFFAYGIAFTNARRNKINQNTAGMLAVSLFLVLAKPEFISTDPFNTQLQINFAKLGAQGAVISMVAALLTGEVLAFFIKRGWTIRGKTLPDFVKDWFEPLIPGVLLIAAGWAVTYLLGFDVYEFVTTLFAPLIQVGNTLPGLMVYFFIIALSWFLGIHPLAIIGFTIPILFGNLAENAQLAASGLAPTVANGFHLNNIGTMFGWIMLGSVGAFLPLNIMMLFSKAPSVKSLGRASIVPQIFNISEPILFGAPVAFNPILGIPMIFIQAFVNTTITFFAMSSGIVAIPFNPTFIPFLPTGVSAFLYSNDLLGVLLVVVLFVVDYLIYYPFFKVYERQAMEKEAEEEKAE